MSITLPSAALPPPSVSLTGLFRNLFRPRFARPGQEGVVIPAARDRRLDFFRGLALLFIFMDHIPDNNFGYFTMKSFGFSDAAEVFIFISGYVASMVYGRVLLEQGLLSATIRIYKRVWTIFIAHIVLLFAFIAEVTASVQRFGNPDYNDQLHVGDFLAQPDIAIVKALSLQFQPTYLDILPVYIVLLAVFPLVLWLIARFGLFTLIPSAILWGCVQIWHWNIPGFPDDREWYFDPLAWQFLFYAGSVFGFAAMTGKRLLPRSNLLLMGCAVIALTLGVMQVTIVLHGLWPTTFDAFPTPWSVDKTSLAPILIVNFAAMAVVASRLPREDAPLLQSRWLAPVIKCGQHSLPVFCCNILLALMANVALHEISRSIFMQAFVNAAGIAALIALSYTISWANHAIIRRKQPALA